MQQRAGHKRAGIRTGLLALLLLAACAGPPYPDGELHELFAPGAAPQTQTVSLQGHALHYARMPGRGVTPLLFVHGSPGDWKGWARFLEMPSLQDYGPRIAVDRPGYGGSEPGAVMPDLRAQAQLLAGLLKDQPPAVLVGHSLGAPLIAWMAIDHPERVCGLVMVAGAVDPQREAPRWYNRFAQSALGRGLLPEDLLRSNTEIMALQAQLQRLDPVWSQLQRPLVVVQGDRDRLVDPRSVDYLQQRVPAAQLQVIRVPDQGHLLMWKRPALVAEAIRRLPCASGGTEASVVKLDENLGR